MMTYVNHLFFKESEELPMLKKHFKKLVSLALTAVMVMGMSVTSFAAETETEIPAYSVTVNEYDIYVQTRCATQAQLARSGMDSDSIDVIKSNAIETKLSELSNKSEKELSQLGYTSEQIDLLQNYNGERIETNTELRGIFADMTCNFYKYSASTSSLAVKVIWNWSNVPVLAGVAIKDIIGIRWQGTNSSGQPLNLALNTNGSSCKISYYSRSGSYKSRSSVSISTDDPYGHAYAKIPMSAGTGDAVGDYYAKKGTLILKVDRTGSNSIKEGAFVFGYGHTIVSVSPSLSLPASFGIGFSAGVETMCEEAIRMNNSGTITKY